MAVLVCVRCVCLGTVRLMKRCGRVGLAVTLLVLLGLPAGAVSASVDLDEVADALRSNPVYVDAQAERALTDDEIGELQSVIRSADTPIYIAVLPASAVDLAGGDPAEVASQLAEAVDRGGTFGVVVGDSFRAGSSELPGGEAGELAAAALEANGDDTAAVLDDFVERVGDAAGQPPGPVTVVTTMALAAAGCFRWCSSAVPARPGCWYGGGADDVKRRPPNGRERRRPIDSC